MNINRSRSVRSTRKIRRGYVAGAVLASVCLLTCGMPSGLEAAESPSRARNAQHGFSFVPPAGWQVSRDYPTPQIRMLYLGPTHRGFRANMNLVVDQDTGESFDQVAQQIKELLSRMTTSWRLAEESQLEINGKKAYYLSATHRMNGQTLRQAQFVVRGGNGKIYVVTYSATDSAFGRLSPAIAQSALTITIE